MKKLLIIGSLLMFTLSITAQTGTSTIKNPVKLEKRKVMGKDSAKKTMNKKPVNVKNQVR